MPRTCPPIQDTVPRLAAATAMVLALLAQPAAQGQRSSYFSYPTPGLGLATTGQAGAMVIHHGWPTVITNTPHIGVFYDNNPPYYYSPSSSLGYPALGYGYPSTFGRRYNPGAPLIFDDSPWYWPRTYVGPPLIEIARRTDPALTRQTAPPSAASALPPPTAAELGVAALRAGAYDAAVVLVESMTEDQTEARGAAATPSAPALDRNGALALALVGAGRFDEAIVPALRAQRDTSTPFDARALLGSSSEIRRLTNAAVAYANRVNTSDAWRLVAFLMEAGERHGVAERMLRRAEALERPPEAPRRRSSAVAPQGPARYSMPAPKPVESADPGAEAPEPDPDSDAGPDHPPHLAPPGGEGERSANA